VSLNKSPVRRAADVTSILRRLKPGDVVEIDILRGNQQMKIRVALGERGNSP